MAKAQRTVPRMELASTTCLPGWRRGLPFLGALVRLEAELCAAFLGRSVLSAGFCKHGGSVVGISTWPTLPSVEFPLGEEAPQCPLWSCGSERSRCQGEHLRPSGQDHLVGRSQGKMSLLVSPTAELPRTDDGSNIPTAPQGRPWLHPEGPSRPGP